MSLFSRFISWLNSPEVFGNISRKIPGEWQLYEYYMDENNKLIHIQEDKLQHDNLKMTLIFTEDVFNADVHIPVSVVKGLEKGQWSTAKNYITFIDPQNFRNNIEFQFAFEKGNLKLLKKDVKGMIEFFGFFKPLTEIQKKTKAEN